jgi:predicted secreted protein
VGISNIQAAAAFWQEVKARRGHDKQAPIGCDRSAANPALSAWRHVKSLFGAWKPRSSMPFSLPLAAAIFLTIWFTVLFAVLPFGVRSQHESGDFVAGTDPGAPVAPRILAKTIWTTLISAVVFAAVAAFATYMR